jgi:hypothetical protein
MIPHMVQDESTDAAEQFGHSGLTSDESNGRVVREAVPAKFLPDGLVEVLGSPALVVGCVAGDVLRIAPDGRFDVVRPGPNLSVQAFADPVFRPEEVEMLSGLLKPYGGIVEVPTHHRFLVATAAVSVAWPAIDAIVKDWSTEIRGVYWQYGTAMPRV